MKKNYRFGGPAASADDDPWKAEFKARSIAYILDNGTPVDNSDRDLYYGYIARDWRELFEHFERCGPLLAKSGNIVDTDWTEFSGTFAPRDWDRKHGLEVTISCKCGKVKDRKWRLEENFGTLIRAITTG
jgi:hypothetical protein